MEKQYSQAKRTMFVLTLSGGLMDAYSYFERDGVFANAQTGNIVLFSTHLMSFQFRQASKYLVPIVAFSLGVLLATWIRHVFKEKKLLHWRQIVVLCEMGLIFMAGLLPLTHNNIANALLSFACAMQVQSFRVVSGSPFASTMCIGNLRSAMDHLGLALFHKDMGQAKLAFKYMCVIAVFALGAMLGLLLSKAMGRYAIWMSLLPLGISYAFMAKR